MNIIKKIIGYIPCQVCYYLGHWTSLLMERFDWWWLLPVYSGLMLWSCDINDWAGMTMWSDPLRGSDDG